MSSDNKTDVSPKNCRLSELLDLNSIQKMADAHYRAAGMPIGIIDAIDGSILVGTGWQDICVKFHRVHPVSQERCRQSDNYIQDRLQQGEACGYKCLNGLWDIGIPIVVAGRHLATMFLGQFFYEGEIPDREFFTRQAHELGFDQDDYLAALDRVPVFSREKVDYIVEYDKALVSFIADLAERALHKAEADNKLQKQTEFLRKLIDAMPYPIFYKDRQGRYISCNSAFEAFYGIQRGELAGKTVHDIAAKELADIYARTDHELFANPGSQQYEGVVQSPVSGRRNVIFHKATFDGPDGATAGIVGAVVDITDRKQMETALETSEAMMRGILDNVGIGVSLISAKMEILEMNRRMHQWFPNVDSSQRPICYQAFNDPPGEQVCTYCPTRKTLQDGLVHEATSRTPQAGGFRNYRIISSPLFNSKGEVMAAIEMVDDITERLSLEAQLRQAQKMEAVGRLAGGVAHDFNNMLGVILGYVDLALEKVDPAQPLHADLEEIRKAADRSTEIVRQLLAFARKQPIAPKIIDLNATVEGTLKMLRRLIGEDIELVWRPDSDLWPVFMDPIQIEQILTNLCVNARDAIVDTGKVTIQTENAVFDETYCAGHPGYQPGKYTLLTICDDGMGMDPETLNNLFEPFFSTKEIGQGTGLGLATVYGIVSQNKGFIKVDSQKGKGTTLKVCLPRHSGRSMPGAETKAADVPVGRGETIMLVEDETPVLKLADRMLKSLGYKVLPADSAMEAMRLAEIHSGEIHLLITDVILPKMNGRELTERIRRFRPEIKCLYMSGYTADVIADRGVLEQGIDFISKPFTKHELAAKARKALDHPG